MTEKSFLRDESKVGYFGNGTKKVMAMVQFFDLDSVNEFCYNNEIIDIVVVDSKEYTGPGKYYVKYWRYA